MVLEKTLESPLDCKDGVTHTRKGHPGWVLSIQQKAGVSMAALESLWVFMDAGVASLLCSGFL